MPRVQVPEISCTSSFCGAILYVPMTWSVNSIERHILVWRYSFGNPSPIFLVDCTFVAYTVQVGFILIWPVYSQYKVCLILVWQAYSKYTSMTSSSIFITLKLHNHDLFWCDQCTQNAEYTNAHILVVPMYIVILIKHIWVFLQEWPL